MAWLDDNAPARSQFRCPRREDPSGVVVVHDTESKADTSGTDSGAANVANFIRTRDTPGSYHDLVDSDSILNLVNYWCEAYHDGTGSNRHSYGVSGCYRVSEWPNLPKAYRDKVVDNMARAAANYAKWLKTNHGIVIPPRRITREESEARKPGFISHGERDPARRTDPGPLFPWGQFLERFAQLTGSKEEDDMTPEEFTKLVTDEKSDVALAIRKYARKGTNDAVDSNDARKDGGHSTKTQPLDERLAEVLAAAGTVQTAEAWKIAEVMRHEIGAQGNETTGQAIRRIVIEAVAGTK
jgi:hypothetical protein